MASKKKDVIPGLTSEDCIEALRSRFEPRAWAFFEQVAPGTGWKANTWVDALAVSLWPSRGIDIHGFEIKVSTQDWKRELKNPAKNSEVQAFCDHFWLVAPRGLIPLDTLPSAWGLIEVNEKKKPHTLVAAPKLEAKPVTRAFMAAVLRRCSQILADVRSQAKHEGREEGAKSGAGELAERLGREESRHRDLRDRVAAFEKASGIEIQFGYQLGKVGDAVKLLTNLEHRDAIIEQFKRDAEAYRHRLKSLEKDIAALEKVRMPVSQEEETLANE